MAVELDANSWFGAWGGRADVDQSRRVAGMWWSRGGDKPEAVMVRMKGAGGAGHFRGLCAGIP